jgi:CheY-like chemotaxis protein
MQVSRPAIVVDDDEDDQGFIRDIFEDLHVENELKSFIDGTSFLAYLRTTSDKPLLILTDISMQHAVSGLELRDEIQNDTFLRDKKIPLIFFTTSKGKHIEDKVYHSAVQGYFIKESSYEAMKEQIRTIIEYWQHSYPYLLG